MISLEDQNSLFKLISNYLKKDIVCWAFGGTAMMFYGYKDSTKDIDLVFDSAEDRNVFIEAIEELGYTKRALFDVYNGEKSRHKNAPVMYSRGDERFDLFLKNIFQTVLSLGMKKRFFARHDFTEKKSLVIYAVSKEDIILLKAVTEREKDFEDILKICATDKNISWGVITDEAVSQYEKGNEFVLLDLEQAMVRLKKYIFIKQEYFSKLYRRQK